MKSALSLLCCVGLLATYAWWQLRDLPERTEKVAEEAESAYEIKWVEWKPGLFEAEREAGRVVWLSFTAEW